MSKPFSFAWLALVVLMLIAACGRDTSDGGSSAELVQKVNGVRISIALDPNPLLANQNTVVEVKVTDDKGGPISDARVIGSLNPAVHGMPPAIAAAEPKGNGTYTVMLKPTGMTGDHYLNVDLEWQGKAYQARFNNLSVK